MCLVDRVCDINTYTTLLLSKKPKYFGKFALVYIKSPMQLAKEKAAHF
jgi:hypothetical protein